MGEEKEVKRVIGLMSGTSCDSIDAGLCEVYPDLSVKLVKGINHPYPEHINFNRRIRQTGFYFKPRSDGLSLSV